MAGIREGKDLAWSGEPLRINRIIPEILPG